MQRLGMVVIVVVGIVAAGCGGGSDSSGRSAAVPSTSAVVTTVERPLTTVADSPPDSTDVASGAAMTTTTAAPATTTTTLPPDSPPPNGQLVALQLGVELVVDLRLPTAIAWRADDPAMYVSTEDGFVHRVDGTQIDIVADLSGETVPFEPGSERGLLGLAFDPRDGRMFVNYTDLDHDTHVVSFEMVDGIADPASRREVLFIEQPGLGHNGGRLVFDADGNLFIASGDGGGSNGRDAQDTTKLFGVLLRVTPSLDGDGYDIPADNPFADGVLDRPEVWARGFRNPWTFSLDEATGDIWVGDVGNDSREEIDLIPGGTSGQNFGWYWFEGSQQRRSDAPEGMTPPVYDYPRSDGVAVMGGHVYRGDAIADLRGAYVFGDLSGPIWAIGDGGVTRMDAEAVRVLVGWGEDPSGELYLLSLEDGVFRLVQR